MRAEYLTDLLTGVGLLTIHSIRWQPDFIYIIDGIRVEEPKQQSTSPCFLSLCMLVLFYR